MKEEVALPTLTLSKAALTSSAVTVSDRALIVGEVHVVAHGSSVLSTVGYLVGGLLNVWKGTGLWERRLARVGHAVAVSHASSKQ